MIAYDEISDCLIAIQLKQMDAAIIRNVGRTVNIGRPVIQSRMSYASVAAQGIDRADHKAQGTTGHNTGSPPSRIVRRSPSPSHLPKTGASEKEVYVVTLMTDQEHHARLTRLREHYFPAKINKLAAHLTLFHALPGSKLDSDIVPILHKVASANSAFRVHAAKPFRLKRGIAIDVPRHDGGSKAQEIHRALQQPWKQAGFLSDQDAGGCRIHYTIMNKVDEDTEVDNAFGAVSESWKGDWGLAEGIGLWRYDRGFWRFKQKFDFQPAS